MKKIITLFAICFIFGASYATPTFEQPLNSTDLMGTIDLTQNTDANLPSSTIFEDCVIEVEMKDANGNVVATFKITVKDTSCKDLLT